MGSKDARKREVKKPPKKKPTPHELRQAGVGFLKPPPEKK
jgi:hypothetical protein